jgi:hypothetical protein
MKIQVFDNKITTDRYSVLLWFDQEKCDLYLMSDNAFSKDGLCISCGQIFLPTWQTLHRHEKQVAILDLPKGVLAKIVDILAREVDMLLDYEC